MTTNSEIVSQLKLFMEPRSIAIIGVPRHTGDGTNAFENLIKHHRFPGRVYPVNPNAEHILGVRAYPSVKALPETVDLAVILTPRSTVPGVIRECVEKNIKAIIVGAQGFADSDEEGKRMQDEIVTIARKGGARIIGPNTFGVANAFNNLNTAFVLSQMERIPVASMAQTGLFIDGLPRCIVVGKAIDLGNCCDIDFSDALEYFEQDTDIKIILLHMEAIRNGRRFIEVARRVSRKKPIIVLKAGGTKQGIKVAQSHSGSLAGKDEVYNAAFKRCGIIRAEDTDEITDLVKAFLHLPLMKGPGVSVITITMSSAVMAADACQRYGLQIAELSVKTKEKLAAILPPWAEATNPVDLVPPGQITGLGNKKAFKFILDALLDDRNIDGVLFVSVHLKDQPHELDFSGLAGDTTTLNAGKPVVCALFGPDIDKSGLSRYQDAGVVVFHSSERAIRALAKLREYHQFLQTRPS